MSISRRRAAGSARLWGCAVAVVSDGSRHKIAYSIIEDGGLIGAWYGVEWCVRDFDRNWANLGNCNAALPDSVMDW